MIIFDLDGTLADCEHRRHFVDVTKNDNFKSYLKAFSIADDESGFDGHHKITNEKWKPDWKSFYEACDKDEPIYPCIDLINHLILRDEDIQIWSGRCESVRDKTIKWLKQYLDIDAWFYRDCLKMRPIGDYSPDDQLKERWLDSVVRENRTIDFVFDSDPNSIAMWRRRGIFVFDVNQNA